MKSEVKREVVRKGARITETERMKSKSAAAKRKGRRNEARLKVLAGKFPLLHSNRVSRSRPVC